MLNWQQTILINFFNKKIWISTYLENKRLLDKFLEQPVEFMPDNGGYVKTKKIGVVAAGHSSVIANMDGLKLPLESKPLQA